MNGAKKQYRVLAPTIGILIGGIMVVGVILLARPQSAGHILHPQAAPLSGQIRHRIHPHHEDILAALAFILAEVGHEALC